MEQISRLITNDKGWKWMMVRASLAMIFGVGIIVFPIIGLATLVGLFAIYMILDGLLALAAAFVQASRHHKWGFLVFEGALGVTMGTLALFWPGITLLYLVYLTAVWAVCRGVFKIFAAIYFRHDLQAPLFLGLAGLATLAFGAVIVWAPITGAIYFVLVMAAYAMVFGVLTMSWALQLRRYHYYRRQERPWPTQNVPVH